MAGSRSVPGTCGEPGQLASELVTATALVLIERVHLDLLVDSTGDSPVVVVRGIHRRGWADGIHQADREQCWRGRASREADAVEVGQRAERRGGMRAVHGQVGGDLGVRLPVGQVDRPAEVASERDVWQYPQQ